MKCKSYAIKFLVFVFNFMLDIAVGDKKIIDLLALIEVAKH